MQTLPPTAQRNPYQAPEVYALAGAETDAKANVTPGEESNYSGAGLNINGS